MKKTMMAVGLLIGASVFAEVPVPEVCFSFDDELDAGLHVNEGTAGAVANLIDSYSTYGRGRGALYDVGSERIGVYGYSPWCRELALGDSFTVAMSFKASASSNEILFCLGDLDGSDQALMVTTADETSVKVVVVGNRQVFKEARLSVSGGSDRSHLLCLGYANGTFSASVDGGSSVAVGCDRPMGGFQILGGRSASQILPAPFVHGCGVVDPQSGVVSHPNAANVVDDLRIWTTQMLSDEQVAELVVSRFGDAPDAVCDAGQREAVNTAIRRVAFNVGYVTEFLGYGWRVYKRDAANCYLFTTNGIDRIPFSINKDDPDYAKSDFRKRINEIEKQLRGYDGPQMSWEEVDGRGSGYIQKPNLSDVIKEPCDDYLFLMSLNEAVAMGTSRLARDVLNLGDMWYLRTPGSEGNGNVCVVIEGGYISDFGTKAHIRQYVRPSLKVSWDSPLFTRPFFLTNGDDSGKIRKSDVKIGQGFAFGDYFEDGNGEAEDSKTTYRETEIAAPEVVRFHQPAGWIVDVPGSVLEKGVLQLKDTMPVLSHSPSVTYRSSAIAAGTADHLAVIAVRGNLNGLIIDYAKVSAEAEGTDVVIPLGKLPRGRYKLGFFAEKCETGADDHCSKEVGGFNVENVDGRSKDGEWPVSVSNRLFTVRAEGVEIRFPEDVGFVQDFEAGQSGVTFSGLGARGGRIDGKVTVDAAALTVSNMTLSALAVTNGGVLNVIGKLAIVSTDETLIDGSVAFSAGSVLDVKGGRCVAKNVSGAGSVMNSVPERADTAAFVIADRLTVDVTRTDTLSVDVPLTLGTDFEVFVTNANVDVHGEWTILTASQIVAKPNEIKVVADDESTGPWEVKVVALSGGEGEALVLVNSSDAYVRVTVGTPDHQSAVWTSGDGAVTNRVENGFFDVLLGEANTKVIFSPDYGYQFAPGESGVRNLPSPIVEKCMVTPPVVIRSPCAVTFTVDASISQAAYVVEGVTNELSVGLNQVDVPFGSVVELIVREAARYYPYAGPHAFRVTVLEMSVEIAAKPIPKGIEGNPFEIGEHLFATTNKEGVLSITGTGAMSDFVDAADVPWDPKSMTAVAIGEGVTKIGANAWTRMSGNVIVDSGLSLSRYAFVGDGFSPTPLPVGALAPAGAEWIEIENGKVYLGVSVATNADLTATEAWRQADIEGVRKESDGTVTLTVPAPAEKGFMILKSKGK